MGRKRKLSDDPIVKVVRAHGLPTFSRALGFTAAWAVTAESLGHAPTFEEYRDWWAASQRTAYRDWAAFRTVTGLDTPESIWLRARSAGVEFEKDSVANAGGFALLPFMQWNVS